jgi:peptide/nickel transport system permease protein
MPKSVLVENTAINIKKKRKKSEFRAAMTRLRKNKTAMIGIGIFMVLVILAIIAPYISRYGYADMNMGERFQLPSAKHWFGTDELGRDVFTRIMYGGRYSLSVGFTATLSGLVFGIVIGAISGYYGGSVDNIIMRFLDIFQSIPGILMTICIAAVLGAGFDKTIMALAITQIPIYARTLRAQVLSVRELEYVEAANAIGCGTFRQIMKYVLPNSFSPLLVLTTMNVATTVLITASLSYIGLGIQPPTPEWGAMLSSAKGFISTSSYLLVFPGLFIAITVLGLNMFGDGLRDALDPKLKD